MTRSAPGADRPATAILDQARREDWRRAHQAAILVLDQMQAHDWPEHRKTIRSEVPVGPPRADLVDMREFDPRLGVRRS
jgi:hypothetical protein